MNVANDDDPTMPSKRLREDDMRRAGHWISIWSQRSTTFVIQRCYGGGGGGGGGSSCLGTMKEV